MNREIKFRAWDKSEQEMLGNEAIFGNELCIQTGYQDEDFIFMQYTGLIDKNGVEIYCGDIVEHDDHISCRNAVVEFHNGAFRIHKLYTLWEVKNGIEVIGNIYEHSHLLEGN